jgi:hypothetical protein
MNRLINSKDRNELSIDLRLMNNNVMNARMGWTKQWFEWIAQRNEWINR